MGQSESIEEDSASFFSQIMSQEPVATLISEEIHSLTYEKFLSTLSEINLLSNQCLDINGKQLVFAVKKGTDSTVFWKATIQIACVKIDPETQHVETYRLLNLNQFLKVFKTLKCQNSAAEQSRSSDTPKDMTVSAFLNNIDDKDEKAPKSFDSTTSECCICFERKQEIILPCAHSYCSECIEEWNENHDTCPICRAKLESPDDTWLLSEVPRAEEISKEIQENITKLTEDRSPPCTPS